MHHWSTHSCTPTRARRIRLVPQSYASNANTSVVKTRTSMKACCEQPPPHSNSTVSSTKLAPAQSVIPRIVGLLRVLYASVSVAHPLLPGDFFIAFASHGSDRLPPLLETLSWPKGRRLADGLTALDRTCPFDDGSERTALRRGSDA